MEQFANIPNTTLNGAINNSVTSLIVASGSSFPSSGTFRILIDNELIAVTVVSGTTWTISRADGGTTAASHNNGVQIYGIVTKEALDAIVTIQQNGTEESNRRILNFLGVTVTDDPTNHRTNIIIPTVSEIAAYGSIPSAAFAGKLYVPTDGYSLYRDTGSAWQPWGPIYPLKTPDDTGFAWVNQGTTSSYVVEKGGIKMSVARSSGGEDLHCRVIAKPGSTPWSCTALFDCSPYMNGGLLEYGLLYYNSSNTNIQSWCHVYHGNSSQVELANFRWNNPTSYSGNDVRFTIPSLDFHRFLRIEDDGSYYYYRTSRDGQNFTLQYKGSRLSGCDKIGWFVNQYNATYDTTLANGTQVNLLHWDVY